MNILKSLLNALLSAFAIINLSISCTPPDDTVTDVDGNVYTTVTIGNQVWTAENLKTTKYNDGTPLPLVTDRSEWRTCDDSARPAYCRYENDTAGKKTFGALYNWYAVNTGRLAPKGWHVPTDAEWTELENHLVKNGYNWDGTMDSCKIAKSLADTTDWISDSTPGSIGNDLSENNRSGFSALPCGFRLERGDFYDIGYHGYWWSATEYDESRAWRRSLYHDKMHINRSFGTLKKGSGFSVRLLKN